MKKVLLFAGVLFLFSATSCKKDYTCSCEWLGTTTDTVFEKSTKKDAEDKCAEANTELSAVGGSCAIK